MYKIKSLNESSPYSPVNPKLTPSQWSWSLKLVITNVLIISGNQQRFLGQGDLVMVLVPLTLCKIIMPDFNIYSRVSTWQCQDCQEYFARISLKWDMDIGKILFTLSYVKYKQFDFSLLANVKYQGVGSAFWVEANWVWSLFS